MILERLKQETAALHEQVEGEMNILARIQSRERYAELLAKMLGFHGPLEERLAEVAATHPIDLDLVARRKSQWLWHDLHFLGCSTEVEPCPELPTLRDECDLWGCMYVLEGSTLGGQHISRAVQKTLELEPGQGCSFFNAYGEATGEKWREFRERCAAFAGDDGARGDAIVAAAVETFRCFEAWAADDGIVPAPNHL